MGAKPSGLPPAPSEPAPIEQPRQRNNPDPVIIPVSSQQHDPAGLQSIPIPPTPPPRHLPTPSDSSATSTPRCYVFTRKRKPLTHEDFGLTAKGVKAKWREEKNRCAIQIPIQTATPPPASPASPQYSTPARLVTQDSTPLAASQASDRNLQRLSHVSTASSGVSTPKCYVRTKRGLPLGWSDFGIDVAERKNQKRQEKALKKAQETQIANVSNLESTMISSSSNGSTTGYDADFEDLDASFQQLMEQNMVFRAILDAHGLLPGIDNQVVIVYDDDEEELDVAASTSTMNSPRASTKRHQEVDIFVDALENFELNDDRFAAQRPRLDRPANIPGRDLLMEQPEVDGEEMDVFEDANEHRDDHVIVSQADEREIVDVLEKLIDLAVEGVENAGSRLDTGALNGKEFVTGSCNQAIRHQQVQIIAVPGNSLHSAAHLDSGHQNHPVRRLSEQAQPDFNLDSFSPPNSPSRYPFSEISLTQEWSDSDLSYGSDVSRLTMASACSSRSTTFGFYLGDVRGSTVMLHTDYELSQPHNTVYRVDGTNRGRPLTRHQTCGIQETVECEVQARNPRATDQRVDEAGDEFARVLQKTLDPPTRHREVVDDGFESELWLLNCSMPNGTFKEAMIFVGKLLTTLGIAFIPSAVIIRGVNKMKNTLYQVKARVRSRLADQLLYVETVSELLRNLNVFDYPLDQGKHLIVSSMDRYLRTVFFMRFAPRLTGADYYIHNGILFVRDAQGTYQPNTVEDSKKTWPLLFTATVLEINSSHQRKKFAELLIPLT